MKVPFSNISADFSKEFKESLGFSDIDIPLRKIKPDLNLAAKELIEVIGNETYEELIVNYNLKKEGEEGATQPYQDEDLNTVFQYAIASYAYMLHAPANDLAHTSNGRRMRSSENQKTPFEWMLAKDDDNLQRRAYQAIDLLIQYMDANFEKWKQSDQFKITHKLFVRTVKDFSEAYIIESRLLLIKLVPGIKRAEKREILPRLGKELYGKLKEKIIHAASSEEENEEMNISEDESLLIDYIKEACAYYSLHWSITRLQLNLFPEGILQSVRGERTTIKGRSVPVVPIVDQVSKFFKLDADEALLSIENQLNKMFPIEEEQTEEQTLEDTLEFDASDPFVST